MIIYKFENGQRREKENKKMEWLKMEISPNFSFVPGIRSCISRTAYNFGFDDREAYHIEIVIDEICNNAIEYGSKKRNGKIKLECKFTKNEMEFILKDYGGKEFNVDDALSKNFNLLKDEVTKGEMDTPRRGRGLIIVKKLVDRLDIKTGKNGTQVRFIKRKALKKPDEQPSN